MADSGNHARSGRMAKDAFTQAAHRDILVKQEQEKAYAAAAAKIARLRALRIAKHAAEKAAADQAAPEAGPAAPARARAPRKAVRRS